MLVGLRKLQGLDYEDQILPGKPQLDLAACLVDFYLQDLGQIINVAAPL